jgi:type IV pilus assembly protein PilB
MAKKLGEALIERGLVKPQAVEAAMKEQAETHQLLGEILLRQGAVQEGDLYRAMAHLYGVAFGDATTLLAEMDRQLVERVPRRFQEFNHVVPIRITDGHLVVATTNPLQEVPQLASTLGAKHLQRVLVTPTDFRRLRNIFLIESSSDQASAAAAVTAAEADERGDLLSGDAPSNETAQRLLDSLLLDAVAMRASDIHVETYKGNTRVRIRVDGDLRDLTHYAMSPAQRLAVLNVIKVRSDLDIAERRLPQGGRFVTRLGDAGFDIRVQMQPSLHGEHAVLRLLPQDSKLVGMRELGFPQKVADAYRRLLDAPGGLVLVVGPTGSGKSTTLYAGLQVLAADTTRKVITIEDPIEYALDGIQQVQARPEIGFEFAHAMRAFVREDPDVILVGEIRDGETALEALRASQTGHLVLSTLHCNDTTDAVQRLIDLGQHPNSIGSELLAVFAQRLVKRICKECRVEAEPPADLVREVFPAGVPADLTFYSGKGCDRCHGVGFKGRIALVEFLPASPAMRMAISRRASVDELRQIGLGVGLMPMREHALGLVREGLIALDELKTAITPERLAPEVVGGPERLVG